VTVEERVRKVIAETFSVDPEKIMLESSLTDDLGADSLDAVEVIVALEDEFGIEIPDEDVQGTTDIGEAITGNGNTAKGRLVVVKDIISYLEGRIN